MTTRRELILVLGTGMLGIAHPSWPQQKRIPKVGYLSPISVERDSARSEAFRQGLVERGYVIGKSVILESRFADGKLDKLPTLVKELLRANVDVIVAAGGNQIALAVKRETATVPIVMTNVEDPVANKLVESLARPGGNLTGMSAMIHELSAKRLNIVRDILPNGSLVAVLWNANYPEKRVDFELTVAAAKKLGVKVLSLDVRSHAEIGGKLLTIPDDRGIALIAFPDPVVNSSEKHIIEYARKRQILTMFSQRAPVDAGGLISYGPSYADLFRRAAFYVDRILRGAKPADLPVEQPIKFEMVVNLETAKALGITIPPTVMVMATSVIG